jgi:hypothetical protein
MWLAVVLYFANWPSGASVDAGVMTRLVTLGFTPPAVLWLIWALLRQSRTLRTMQGQLHLQIQETQRLVVQQKRMVEELRVQQKKVVDELRTQRKKWIEDLRSQRAKELQASRPILRMKTIGIGGTVQDRRIVHFLLCNHGRTCTDVVLKFDNGHAPQEFGRLSDGGELPFNLALSTGTVEAVGVTVSYLDQQLRKGSRRFVISGGDPSFQVNDVVEADPD